jgi:predicted lipid-binding transport protein (Tim44 family)
MRMVTTLTAFAVLAILPAISQAQSPPADDHKGHHPAQAQAPVAPAAPGGMDKKGGGMMGGDMSRMMTMMHGGMLGTSFADAVRGTAKKRTPRSLFRVTNCMIYFAVDRNGIIEGATTTSAKCRIGPHGDMHPPPKRSL